jgi:hypothetical protein
MVILIEIQLSLCNNELGISSNESFSENPENHIFAKCVV